MIRLYATVGQRLLQRHAHRGPATPDRDDQRWVETTLENLDPEFNGVFEEVLRGNYGLVHFCYL